MNNTLKTEVKNTAFITGGAVRIGRAMAISLAKNGYDIALHYNSSRDEALEVQSIINDLGQNCQLFQADLAQDGQVKQLANDVFSKYSNVNLLINNAAIFEKEDFLNVDDKCFDRHMNINLKAPFMLAQEFAKNTNKGQIINILDTQITRNTDSYFIYLLTKKSLYELSKMLAKKLSPNIRVNGLCLGSILPSKHWSADDIQRQASKLPLQTKPSIDNLEDSLLYLVNSDYLTGQFIFLDGGDSINR